MERQICIYLKHFKVAIFFEKQNYTHLALFDK